MWYFILILYMGQIKGTFGIYEPITYRTGCTLWGIVFIISGVFLIRVAKHPSQRLKLGREVSRVLLFSYPLELALAFTYSIFGCIDLVSVYLSLAYREMLLSSTHALGGDEVH
ncbi:Membrane-spanning 4-domains subfamily A member 13 [Pteropus alecto]|uniref:Membrane-spanning 4-domains subfamily A member 13 n=1 Tax=Pteropus alecto TaxID=9402 RepID=L5KQ92_PTEAL|nr:Membrane-spanning 4-domains subfamily A member 13 [Pteropus alecto]